MGYPASRPGALRTLHQTAGNQAVSGVIRDLRRTEVAEPEGPRSDGLEGEINTGPHLYRAGPALLRIEGGDGRWSRKTVVRAVNMARWLLQRANEALQDPSDPRTQEVLLANFRSVDDPVVAMVSKTVNILRERVDGFLPFTTGQITADPFALAWAVPDTPFGEPPIPGEVDPSPGIHPVPTVSERLTGNIDLTERFFKADALSQAAAIVHEMSHKYCGTEDYAGVLAEDIPPDKLARRSYAVEGFCVDFADQPSSF